MKVTEPIRKSLADEHVIGVDPKLKPDLPGVWRRRINAFSGRAISDKALTAEQDMRSGLQRLQGTSMTAGIIEGMAAVPEAGSIGAAPAEAFLRIETGLGLARSGEDVTVPSTRRVRLGAIPVVVPVGVANALDSGAAAPADPAPTPAPASEGSTGFDRLSGSDPLALRLLPELPRTASLPLGEAIGQAASDTMPRVAVLVAQPVHATILGRPGDHCPPDPRDDPYSDLQRIDGCRLLLYFWPSEMTSRTGGSDYSLPPRNGAFRNRLAYRVFDMERSLKDTEMHPWEAWGVPLALVSFADDWSLQFVDRAAVVRKGGAPRMRTSLVPRSGHSQLWQARIEQLVEQLADLPDLEAPTLRKRLNRIPPAAVLPGSCFDPVTRRQTFFPSGFGLNAIPIPRSDLELAVRESASLIPFNMAVADRVEILVPVPDAFYEPGLLQVASVSPEFADAITEFEGDRALHLSRREFARRRYDRLVESISGTAHGWPASDSPPVEINAANVTVPLVSSRTRRFTGVTAVKVHSVTTTATLPVAEGDTLWAWILIHNAAQLTGLSLRVATPGDPPAFGPGVFWGAANNLQIASETADLAARRAGDLPAAGSWIRVEVSADQPWLAGKHPLVGSEIAGIEFAQKGGDIEYGAFGKTDADGRDIVWIADDAPGAATFRTGIATSAPADWPWNEVPGRNYEGIGDFGTMLEGNSRHVAAIRNLQGEWSQPFLAEDMARLGEVGLEGYLDEVEAKISATNDAIDVGFIRARSDIYRVRQFMLGADSASRLVTSPSLADLAKRDEGARATSEGISKFIDLARARKAEGIRFKTPPPEAPAASAPAPTPTPTPVSWTGAGAFDISSMRNNVGMLALMAGSAPTPTPTPAPTPTSTGSISYLIGDYTIGSGSSSHASALASTALFGSITPTPSPTPTSSSTATYSYLATPLVADYASLSSGTYLPMDVRAQRPLPGLVERTISVAERLKPSPAVQALEFAIASKGAVLGTLKSLMQPSIRGRRRSRAPGVPLGDLGVPGFGLLDPAAPPPTLARLFEDQGRTAGNRLYVDLDVMIDDKESKHESDYFTAAVTAIDNAIALMRLVEGRIALYESLANRIRETREEVLGLAKSARALLRSIDVQLEEARHDIATATMLLDEETERVQSLNARRAKVLTDHVGAIAYRRVRESETAIRPPMQDLLSGLAEPPLAACRRDHPDAPDELQRYAALVGDAPVEWFPAIAAEVERIDRLEAAREALEHSRKLASVAQALAFDVQPLAALSGAARYFGSARFALQAQQKSLVERRLARVAKLKSISRKETLREVHADLKKIATLSDVAAGRHRNAALTAQAAREIAGFGEIAACLHAGFADTPPVVRLGWAEILSEFDRPAALHSLAGLPRWAEIPRQERKTLQSLVDYLFSRIDRKNGKAVAFVNELVRVAMLLSAHAPVDRLIPARLVNEASSAIGTRLTLAVDTKEARKGMVALIRDARDRLISKALIDDIGDGQAGARIITNYVKVSTIVPSMRIELAPHIRKLR